MERNTQIPKGWEEIELKNVLKYEQPYKYEVENTNYSENGIPVLTAGKSFILGYTNESSGIYKNTPVIIFDDFTTDCKFVDFEFKVKSSAMKFLKETNDVCLRLVFELLSQQKIKETGGDHKRRWISDYSKRKIILPKSTEEQEKIAEVLGKVDEAIGLTEKLINKYERIKTGLMQDLLTKGIDEHGNIRSHTTHKFKNSPLGLIPVEWECEKLPTVAKLSRGKFTPRPRNNPIYYGGEYPFIQTGDISNSKTLFLNKFTQTLNEKGILVSKKFPKNTIIITIAANIGETAILGREMYLTDSVVGIIAQQNYVYLELFIKTQKTYLENISTESAQKNINIEKLNDLFIKVPKIQEQTKISEIYLNMLSKIDTTHAQLNKLRSIKKGMMQDLLSGRVRVNELLQES